jgi:GNAT superfamily N-acetyltransferase
MRIYPQRTTNPELHRCWNRPAASGSAEVLALVPGQIDGAVIATDDAGQPIGAAWWHLHEPPLLRDADGQAVPELVMAVVAVARDRGVGTALIEALVQEATRQSFSAVALNVHLRNPAARLYMRTGFRVAGAGRGGYGVAMMRALAEGLPVGMAE